MPLGRTLPILLSMLVLPLLGVQCGSTGTSGPTVALTLNAIPEDQNDLLVVPPSGFVVQVTFAENVAPVDPTSFVAGVEAWGEAGGIVELTSQFDVTASGATALVSSPLAVGTHTLTAYVEDVQGRGSVGTFDFAVRGFLGGSPPIDPVQFAFFDFESDRDGVPGPDFPVDLQAVGLGSPAAPALSAVAESMVRSALLARVTEVYWNQDPNGIGFDAVPVIPLDFHPGSSPTTTICVGGEDPSGGVTLGSVLIDPNNANPESVECATIPPTGIFPREILVWQNNTHFKEAFDPFMPAAGGTPVGEHALDPVVLDPAFDPGTASPEALARWDDLAFAVERYGDAIGSVMAHELGHALGLVQPGPPGGGCFGGSSGATFSHSVDPGGGTPSENFLMKAGGTFSFSKLAGAGSHPLPYFRPIEHAYLRNRIVQDASVTQLLAPPEVDGFSPPSLSVATAPASTIVTVTGSGFVSPGNLVLRSPSWTYYAIGEQVGGGGTTLTATVIDGQLLPGDYAVEIHNPDGQTGVAPGVFTALP